MLDFVWHVVLLVSCCSVSPQDPPAVRTRTLVVRMVDGGGKPLAGVGLAVGSADELLVADALERPLARSGADGTLRAKLNLPAPTLLLAAPGKIALSLWHHPALTTDDADAMIDLGEVALFDGVTLRGRVMDDGGKPLAGARVSALDMLVPSTDVRPRYCAARSAALSDANGLFALPCVVDRGLELTVTKEGHYQRRICPVGRETPLVLELRASGFIEGRVFDEWGRGVATTLGMAYECGAGGYVSTDASGAFRATVLQPGRYRLSYRPGSGKAAVRSAVLEGPQKGLELRPSAPSGPRVVVRAVGENGKELETFQAAGFWDDRTQVAPDELLLHGRAQLVRSGPDRRVTLLPPGSQLSGYVVVTSAGLAPNAVRVQLDDKDQPTELTVELGPEARLEGKVLGANGKGLAGASVWARPTRSMSCDSLSPSDAVVTGPDGAFSIGGLAAGNHRVHTFHQGSLLPDPQRVELEAGKTKTGVTFRLQPGVELPLGEVTFRQRMAQDFAADAGRVKGSIDLAAAGGIPSDRLVVLAEPTDVHRMTPAARALRGLAVLGADGKFALELAPGTYYVSLLDLGSGVQLEAAEPLEVTAGGDTEVKLAPHVARVRVRLEPVTQGVPLRVAGLQVIQEDSIKRQMVFMNRDVLLEPGQTEVELWLPAGEFKVKVMSHAGFLVAASTVCLSELASRTTEVPEKGPVEVTIKVAAPPTTAELER